MSCFFGHNIAEVGGGGGGRGDYGMNPKSKKKLSLGAGSYVTITWKSFFTQSQVLLSSGLRGRRNAGYCPPALLLHRVIHIRTHSFVRPK